MPACPVIESEIQVTGHRERLLDSAGNLLARESYHAVSLEQIAHHADLGLADAESLFHSKEDVFLSLLDRIAEDWIEYMRALAASNRRVPVRLQQMLVLRILFRFDRMRPLSDGFAQLLACMRGAYLSRGVGAFEREAELLARVIAEGVASHVLSSKVDPRQNARTLILATNSLLPHCLRARDWTDRAGLERNAVAVSRTLIRGLLRIRRGRYT